MAQHTKGPWRIKANTQGVVGHQNVGAFDVVAHCAQRGNIAANARLIAAAPDLLTALSQLVRAVKFTSGVSLDFAVQQAEAAISKASEVQ